LNDLRHRVDGNIPRWQIEALLMTITIHGGKGSTPRRELHRSAGCLGCEGAESLAGPARGCATLGPHGVSCSRSVVEDPQELPMPPVPRTRHRTVLNAASHRATRRPSGYHPSSGVPSLMAF